MNLGSAQRVDFSLYMISLALLLLLHPDTLLVSGVYGVQLLLFG